MLCWERAILHQPISPPSDARITVPAFLAGLVIGVPILCLEHRQHVALQDLDAHDLLEQDVVALLAIPTARVSQGPAAARDFGPPDVSGLRPLSGWRTSVVMTAFWAVSNIAQPICPASSRRECREWSCRIDSIRAPAVAAPCQRSGNHC